jgi:hypothetical protein
VVRVVTGVVVEGIENEVSVINNEMRLLSASVREQELMKALLVPGEHYKKKKNIPPC